MLDQSSAFADPPPIEPRPVAGGSHPLGRTVIAWFRVIVRAGFISMALVGAFVAPPVAMLVGAPLTGAALGIAVAFFNPAFPSTAWARRGAVLTGATGVGSVPFVHGVALFGNAGGVVALVLLILGSCVAATWLTDMLESAPPGDAVRDDRWVRMVLPSLPTSDLLHEWRATQKVFGSWTGTAERTRAVELRACLLEELARRDPAAVERWLTRGDWASAPRIRRDRDVAG
jgi:hypothetical protein